jgi:hypothetical protein
VPKPAFHCEREIGFTAGGASSRGSGSWAKCCQGRKPSPATRRNLNANAECDHKRGCVAGSGTHTRRQAGATPCLGRTSHRPEFGVLPMAR